MKRNIIILFVLSLALVMIGCGGKIRYPQYYTLELAPTPSPDADDSPGLGTVAVSPFGTSQYLRQGRIVYREAPNQIAFYEYHRWAADPGATVTTTMIETLRSAGPFSLVEPFSVHDKPQYLLTGRLERLDEIDYGGGVRVEAKLSAQLVNLRTGATVWVGDAAETSTVETRTLKSVVDAMSTAVQACIDQLIASMQNKLHGTAPAPPRV